ncbi:glycoside hydrolase family 3 N-terminal domain-containing protein [Lacticaseibacillus sp. 866-1]|nr:glycoside hydrolase family 3 N-terminal domain-containing protein [Lacticaseibacillus sp. 866-1]
MKGAEEKVANQITDEGTILLKNSDGTMPFKEGTEFSLFSANSVPHTKKGGTSLGGKSGDTMTVRQSLEKAGFKVNQKLWHYYAKGAGHKYGLGPGSVGYGRSEDFSINEAPISSLKKSGVLNSVKGTVPVYVLKRQAGEGRDMARSMANYAKSNVDKDRSYLDLDSTERGVLKYLNDNYENVVVLVNTNAAVDMGWLADYPHIHAVISAPTITASLGKIFSGAVNPSARTVDTFADDALQSPAAKNVGDFQYSTQTGKMTKYNYVSYKEGIYVGYKYYETRYEDAVLNQGNAGKYNYDSQVKFPFGYGLSYTDFRWQDYKVKDDGDKFKLSVRVTNTGKTAGKDVVEFYAQSPYTNYDRTNDVEKASVQLVNYAKTKNLAPGASQVVSATVNKTQLLSYDSQKAKSYILDKGTYYLTAATNAHEAINNILALKGTTADKLSGQADRSLATTWLPQMGDKDVQVFKADSTTGNRVTNQFDNVRGNLKYLTRQDWTGTFPTADGRLSDQKSTWGNAINSKSATGTPETYTWTKTASKKLLKQLDSTSSGAPKLDTGKVKLVYGQKNGLELVDLRGKPYNDPEWNKLLNQLSAKDYESLVADAGYNINPIKSVNKPYNIDADAANGLVYSGTGRMYPNSMNLAQTWNRHLATKMGRMIGNQAILGGADGWYAPSMNIHRTPFDGRNGEYYSEDSFLSGEMASDELKGAAEKGVYGYFKHFALNEQENHRGDTDGQFGLATWANEQSIREIYLTPFEMCAKKGSLPEKYYKKVDGKYVLAERQVPIAKAVMTSFNRIGATWAGGDYALLTNVLRKEWGFHGMVMTDNAMTSKYMDVNQMLSAGGDAKLIIGVDPTGYKFNKNNKTDYALARQAAHNILYTSANSKVVNGAIHGSKVKIEKSTLDWVRIGVTAFCVLVSLLLIWFTYRRFTKKVA